MSDRSGRPVFFWLVLVICGLYAGLFTFTIYAVTRYHGVEKAPGWGVRTDGTGWFVTDVDAGGPAAAVKWTTTTTTHKNMQRVNLVGVFSRHMANPAKRSVDLPSDSDSDDVRRNVEDALDALRKTLQPQSDKPNNGQGTGAPPIDGDDDQPA